MAQGHRRFGIISCLPVGNIDLVPNFQAEFRLVFGGRLEKSGFRNRAERLGT
jgi:hypothetical protein